MKYRKKPVVIEAVQFTKESILNSTPKELQLPEWITENPDCYIEVTEKVTNSERIDIKTLEGVMSAFLGDYIIKGIKGEIYPCKADIFEATYEKVEP